MMVDLDIILNRDLLKKVVMKTLQFFLIIPTAIVLVGCSTLSYEEPNSGPRARVRFATEFEGTTVLRAYDDRSCRINETEWMRLKNGTLINTQEKSLGLPLNKYHKNAAKEVYVRSGKEFTGMFEGLELKDGVIYRCGVPFSHTFEDKKDYEVEFIWHRRQCKVSIYEINNSAGSWSRIQNKSYSNNVTSDNAGCFSQLLKTRLY